MGNQTTSAAQVPLETNGAVNAVTTTIADPQLPDKQLCSPIKQLNEKSSMGFAKVQSAKTYLAKTQVFLLSAKFASAHFQHFLGNQF